MKYLLGILPLLALAQPAWAQTVVETDFTISVPTTPGQPDVVESTTIVPLVPNTCFNWHVRLSKVKGAIEISELYTLPKAPKTWGLGDGGNIVVSEDRLSATTSLLLTPEDGWIGSGWCVTAGDPEGDYSFDIFAGDRLLHHFDFELRDM